MLVTFSSKAGADILMLSEHAKPILRIAGKVIDDPFPVRGVFSAEQLPDAIKRYAARFDQRQRRAATAGVSAAGFNAPGPANRAASHVGNRIRVVRFSPVVRSAREIDSAQ